MENLKSILERKISVALARAELLARMTECLRQSLPPEIAEHCRLGDYTDNAAFATLIHYRQRHILKKLNERFSQELGCCFKKARVKTVGDEG